MTHDWRPQRGKSRTENKVFLRGRARRRQRRDDVREKVARMKDIELDWCKMWRQNQQCVSVPRRISVVQTCLKKWQRAGLENVVCGREIVVAVSCPVNILILWELLFLIYPGLTACHPLTLSLAWVQGDAAYVIVPQKYSVI